MGDGLKNRHAGNNSLRNILLVYTGIPALLSILLLMLLIARFIAYLNTGEYEAKWPIFCLLGASVICLLVALFGIIAVCRRLSVGFKTLTALIRDIHPENPKALPAMQIREWDDLISAINETNRSIVQHASHMSTIIQMVGLPIGAFEILEQNQTVFVTKSLCKLLRLSYTESQYIPMEAFLQLFPGITLPTENGKPHEARMQWAYKHSIFELSLHIRLVRQGAVVYGTIMDISEEEQQKKWLEYERDYDPLTKLLNRNAYPARMSALIKAQPDKIGVLLFGDLDNLKTINDTYGHDMGDRYIQKTANVLQRFEAIGGVVARISGDEFAVYLHGGDTQKELREKVDHLLTAMRNEKIDLPDGSAQKIRISVGLAYYPFDADNIDMLVRYADFAMYEIKHSVKGDTREFDLDSFEKNSFILHKLNQLDRLIEYRRLTFAYQPIIDVQTGAVFGYEALLRPLMREIHTPREVLTLAKNQSKLYQIEKLTLSYTLNWYKKNQNQMGTRKLFINLITSQKLSAEDMKELEGLMENTNGNLVMEIANMEQSDDQVFQDKINMIRGNGYDLALDDYGTGFHNGTSLLKISPDYVKLDMTLVRNVDTDASRQQLLRQIISFAESNNIRVIAEGVETSLELEMIVSLGARYVQGYYTGRPEYEIDKEVRPSCEEAKRHFEKYWGSTGSI